MKRNTLANNLSNKDYDIFLISIAELLREARSTVYRSVNHVLVRTYWEVGKKIIEFEQFTRQDTGYGSKLFEKIAQDLRSKCGKGFSRSNVVYMRLFYLKYPNSQTLSDQLSWSHYVELLMIENDLERLFYQQQVIKENWSLRELKRQKNSALFERLALSKDKKGILELSQRGFIPQKTDDLVKDPYILEFLGIPEEQKYTEKELEQRVIDNLQNFLLELGKGFSFVARQYRISLANKHYYIDLVFYHRILKCFVLIDLKIGEVTHADVGQMNLYLNYFKKEEMTEGDNEPIGIILTKGKEKIMVEYAMGGISNKLFVSKYSLYLPNKKELEEKVRKILNREE